MRNEQGSSRLVKTNQFKDGSSLDIQPLGGIIAVAP